MVYPGKNTRVFYAEKVLDGFHHTEQTVVPKRVGADRTGIIVRYVAANGTGMNALLQRDKDAGELVGKRRRLLQDEKSHTPGAFCSDTRHSPKQ
jgi:hypothetical protein